MPSEIDIWQKIEKTCREIFELFNYREIRPPIFESTDLFSRSIGKETDIVSKEMYTFHDRSNRSLTLRPEATAPVVRAIIEDNLLQQNQQLKLYYQGPMFRYERQQAGRYRQFHQIGVEIFGSNNPLVDAEIIYMASKIFNKLNLNDLVININSVGDKNCRPNYINELKRYFEKNQRQVCHDCTKRLETNPLRILDCKNPTCQNVVKLAPKLKDSLCNECKMHFNRVISSLSKLNVNYQINDQLVRGLDYYTRTTFEVVSNQLGAQNAVCGGGRYDDLVEELGGKSTPATGFAIGLERVVEVMQKMSLQRGEDQGVKEIDLFIAAMGEEAQMIGFELLTKIREKGLTADQDYLGKSLKAQMKAADHLAAKYVYIIGEEELVKKTAILRNMKTAEQKEVAFDKLSEELHGLAN